MLTHYKLDSRPALAAAPVDLAEVKEHLRLFDDNTVSDAYLNGLITTAVDIASSTIGEGVGNYEYIAYYKGFDELKLPHDYVENLSSLQYYNDSEVLTTIATTVWILDTTSSSPTVKLRTGQSWPDGLSRVYEAPVVATYDSNLDATVGPQIEQALLIIVEDLYRNPGSTSSETMNRVPYSAMALLKQYRRQRW